MAATRNVFFALAPPADVRMRLAREAARLHAAWGGRATAPAKLHVTVLFLDAFPVPLDPALVEHARAAGGTIDLPAFELVIGRADRFGRRIGWLGCSAVPAGLQRLHEALSEAVSGRGVPMRREEAYVPHVTVLRDPRHAAPETIEPVRWRVERFALMASGEGEYEVLGAWALR
jgi:2'-5' RNA ligase